MGTCRCQKIWLWSQRTRPPVQILGVEGYKLSKVGKGVPDMHVAFRFRRKNSHFMGNQRRCSSKNLDWSFLCSTYDRILRNNFLKLCFLPDHAFGHIQGQPSLAAPLGQNADTRINGWKLIQHLEICLPIDLRTTEAYFFISVSFKIIEFLCCRYKKNELFIWFCVEESVAKGFIDGCICDSSCRFLRQTTGKIF